MAGVKIQVKLAGTAEVPKSFHHGKAQHKDVQSLPFHSRHLPEPHGFSEFLAQAHRMTAFEWPKALEERQLEAQQLRLVIEDSDTYSYEALLQQGFLPKFLWAELRCRNCATVRLAAQNPVFVRRCGSWMIRPNPSYFDYVQAAKAPKDLQFQPQGFRLIAWWVHPDLQRDSPWFQPEGIPACEPEADHTFDYEPVQPLSDFQTSAVKYLMTWRDLGPEHLAELMQLRADIFEHLTQVYGVSEEELSDYDLQFHTTTAMRNPCHGARRGHFMTLHLQIGVRHCWTLSCMSRHMSLQETIRRLQSQGDVFKAGTQLYFEEEKPDLQLLPPSVLVSDILPFPTPPGFDCKKYFSAISCQSLGGNSHEDSESCGHGVADAPVRKAFVVFGPAGVGKSTVMEKLKSGTLALQCPELCLLREPWTTIDGDLIRKAQPGLSPKETALAKEKLLSWAIRQERSLLIATVRPEDYVERLRAQGYVLHLLPVFCSQEVALRRARAREAETGRASEFAGCDKAFRECIHAFFRLTMASGSVFFVENSGDVPRLWRKLTSAGPAKAARVCFEVFGLAGVPASWTSTSFLDKAGLMRSSRRGSQGRPCKTSQLVFLVGPQGAGKTTTWRQHPEILAQAGLERYTVLDGELFYEAHGGHQVLQELEKDACTSHLTLAEEMRTWKRDAASRAGSQGLDILLPVTGTSPMTDAESMAYFQRLGYKISAILLLVSPQSSSSNAKIRQRLTGRPAMDCFTYGKTCELMEELGKKFDVLYINNDQFQWEVLPTSAGQLRLKMFSQQSSAWRSA
eukprot:s2268_g4.t1